MVSPPRRRVVAAPARRPPAELRSIKIVFETDPSPEIAYLEQDEFKGRLKAYKRNEWSFVCCYAEAEVAILEIAQTLRSGGLLGIESDSEQEYLDEVAREEWLRLRDVLKTVGIPTEQLPLEVDRSWVEWRT